MGQSKKNKSTQNKIKQLKAFLKKESLTLGGLQNETRSKLQNALDQDMKIQKEENEDDSWYLNDDTMIICCYKVNTVMSDDFKSPIVVYNSKRLDRLDVKVFKDEYPQFTIDEQVSVMNRFSMDGFRFGAVIADCLCLYGWMFYYVNYTEEEEH